MIDERRIAKAISNEFGDKYLTRESWDCISTILNIIADASKCTADDLLRDIKPETHPQQSLLDLYKNFKDREEFAKGKHSGLKESAVWSKAAFSVYYYLRQEGVEDDVIFSWKE